jgi:hypothetical protein
MNIYRLFKVIKRFSVETIQKVIMFQDMINVTITKYIVLFIINRESENDKSQSFIDNSCKNDTFRSQVIMEMVQISWK